LPTESALETHKRKALTGEGDNCSGERIFIHFLDRQHSADVNEAAQAVRLSRI
jgi:hypothetical protein